MGFAEIGNEMPFVVLQDIASFLDYMLVVQAGSWVMGKPSAFVVKQRNAIEQN